MLQRDDPLRQDGLKTWRGNFSDCNKTVDGDASLSPTIAVSMISVIRWKFGNESWAASPGRIRVRRRIPRGLWPAMRVVGFRPSRADLALRRNIVDAFDARDAEHGVDLASEQCDQVAIVRNVSHEATCSKFFKVLEDSWRPISLNANNVVFRDNLCSQMPGFSQVHLAIRALEIHLGMQKNLPRSNRLLSKDCFAHAEREHQC
mmetsp:Transcript_28934/g.68588  ORF Transcript_28934/g.68588 Transcript_28934/m.68588 type:complete len:204 (+) Transcript_28934:4031-4642(+)